MTLEPTPETAIETECNCEVRTPYVYPDEKLETDLSDYERIMRPVDAHGEPYSGSDGVLVLDPIVYRIHRPLIGTGIWASGDDIMPYRQICGTIGKKRQTVIHAQQLKDELGEPREYLWNGEVDAVAIIGVINNYFDIEKVTFDANNIAAFGAMFQTISNGRFRDISAENGLKGGFIFETCQTSFMENIAGTKNNGFGVLFIRCNAARIIGIKTTDNAGDGLVLSGVDTKHGYNQKNRQLRIDGVAIEDVEETFPGQGMIDGSSSFSYDPGGYDPGNGGVLVLGVVSERNGGEGSEQIGHGLVLYKVQTAKIEGGWLEGNLGNAIFIQDSITNLISSMKIIESGYSSSETVPEDPYERSWLRIQGYECNNNIIENCMVEPSGNNVSKVISVQSVRGVQGADVANEWDVVSGVQFHDQIFKIVKVTDEKLSYPAEEGSKETGADDFMTISIESGHADFPGKIADANIFPFNGAETAGSSKRVIDFLDDCGKVVASGEYSWKYNTCLQFKNLSVEVYSRPSVSSKETYTLNGLGHLVGGPDPLMGSTLHAVNNFEAVTARITVGDYVWTAILEKESDNNILRRRHQLNINLVKHNSRHFPSGNRGNLQIQRRLRLVDEVESKILD